MDSRTILQDLAKAVGQLEQALSVPADSDVVQAGCIQYFEFCFELAWRVGLESNQGAGSRAGLARVYFPKVVFETGLPATLDR